MLPRSTAFALATAALLSLPLPSPAQDSGWKVLETRKISDSAGHSAFTDLVRFGDAWLCVFREGSSHVPGTDGVIRVLRSTDGKEWKTAAVLAEKGVDLRDPKIATMPDGRLQLLVGGSIYDGDETVKTRKRTDMHPRVSFSTDGVEWTQPAKIDCPPSHWLWRVTWHEGTGYGIAYTHAEPNRFTAALWSTKDGKSYSVVSKVEPPGAWPNESTLRFLPDGTMLALVRSEDPKNRDAWWGKSKPPYTEWQWNDAGRAAQGPNFLALPDGRLVYSGRDFPNGARTVVGEIRDGKCEPKVTLPSGGDNSYPGLVWHKGELWVSYYSSHEGKTAIYLARIAPGA